MSKELCTNSRVITTRVAADVGHQHFYLFYGKPQGLRIDDTGL